MFEPLRFYCSHIFNVWSVTYLIFLTVLWAYSAEAGLCGSVGLVIGGCGFNPPRGRQRSFVKIDYEIFSMVILSLQLIQEGQSSVSGERMHNSC